MDILTGGFPCQDISVAGKQAGLAGEKSGLWSEMFAVIKHTRPGHVLIENVRNLRTLGLREVLTDLASIGYAAEWQTVQALAAGALHKRSRMFIVAYPDGDHRPLLLGENLRDDYEAAFRRNRSAMWSAFPCSPVVLGSDLPTDVRGDRLVATGNAVCPQQAEPIARALLAPGRPWNAAEHIAHELDEMPFAGALRGGRLFVQQVAVPEWLAMKWHHTWCADNAAAARSVLPSGRDTYPTPSATDYGSSQNGINGVGGANERPSAGTPSLTTMARRGEFPLWPTACTTDSASAARHTTTAEGMHGGTTLTDAVRLWATPAAANWRSGSVTDACFDANSRPLQEQVLRLYPTPTSSMQTPADMEQARWAGQNEERPSYADAAQRAGGRFLNPEWVAWLMGFPANWFDGTSEYEKQMGLFA